MSKHKYIGGANAANNGNEAERQLYSLLTAAGLRENHYAQSLKTLVDKAQGMLYEDGAIGYWMKQCPVPLVSPPDEGKRRTTVVDVAISNFENMPILLSMKSQTSNGTAEQKLWYEIQELINTQIPACMLVIGPVKGNGKTGWSPELLMRMWDWTRFHGKQIFLFRSFKSLNVWLLDKFQIPGKNGLTHAYLFDKYCDKNPLEES